MSDQELRHLETITQRSDGLESRLDWKAGAGKVVGILGIGGLGPVAIRIAKAMGAHGECSEAGVSRICQLPSPGSFTVMKFKL